MTDVSSTIDLAPVIAALSPLVTAAVVAAVGAIVSIILNAFSRWKIAALQLDDSQRQLIAAAASNEAGKIAAGMLTNDFAQAKITIDNPAVVQAANAILGADAANLKAALKATGATPSLVASLVTGAIGELQAKAAK